MQRPALFSRSTVEQLNLSFPKHPALLSPDEIYEQRKTAAWRENRQVSTAKIWAIIFQYEEILVLLTAVSLLSVWNVTRTKEGSFALAYLLSSGAPELAGPSERSWTKPLPHQVWRPGTPSGSLREGSTTPFSSLCVVPSDLASPLSFRRS
jgi:hypothetical protein